jgi:cytochrome c biogenesis protein CcmG, thiol:disulfide interchange protein DsbE
MSDDMRRTHEDPRHDEETGRVTGEGATAPGSEPTLADTDESQDERGRIGYGRYERRSSWILGGVLVLIVLAIGLFQALGGDDGDTGSRSSSLDVGTIGEPAPDFSMETFDGEVFTLSEHRGQVVVMNFWGSWCEPCKREMPAFQSAWENSPDDVMFVGVGSKRDPEDKAIAFAEEYGVTYPIGRDTEGGTVAAGQISKDYNVSFYPMTYIIAPGGEISALVIGEMNEEDLESYIDQARDRVNEQ